METNKQRLRQFVDVVQNHGQLERLEEFAQPNIIDHQLREGMPVGVEGVRAMFASMRTGFPDHDAEVVHMIEEGDLVATYKTLTGTHTGEFLGMPATGRKVTIRVMDFVRYEDGKVAEHWGLLDVAGLQAQLSA